MINKQLFDYIKLELSKGLKKDVIVDRLIKAGWKQDEIEQAFTSKANYDEKLSREGSGTKKEIIKTVITGLLLIVFFPIGLILMWFWVGWRKWLKVVITIFELIIIIGLIFGFLAINPKKIIKETICVKECSEIQDQESCIAACADLGIGISIIPIKEGKPDFTLMKKAEEELDFSILLPPNLPDNNFFDQITYKNTKNTNLPEVQSARIIISNTYNSNKVIIDEIKETDSSILPGYVNTMYGEYSPKDIMISNYRGYLVNVPSEGIRGLQVKKVIWHDGQRAMYVSYIPYSMVSDEIAIAFASSLYGPPNLNIKLEN